MNRTGYPTLDQVEQATRTDVCRWYRFLPSPLTDQEKQVLDYIMIRFKELGGFTPSISKEIGW